MDGHAGAGKRRSITISRVFLRGLLVIVVLGFLSSMTFTFVHQTLRSESSAVTLLNLNVQDVRQDVMDASDKNLLDLTCRIAGRLDGGIPAEDAFLLELLERYDVAEINVINENGIIIATTLPQFLNYDMRDGAQSGEFMVLLDGGAEAYVQNYQPTSFDPALFRKYAAVKLEAGGFVQVGYDGERFHRDIGESVINAAKNRHVGKSGCIIIASEDWNIVSDRHGLEGQNLKETGIWIDRDSMPEGEVFRTEVYGVRSACVYIFTEGYYILAVLPENEIILERDSSLRVMGIMEILLFIALFAVIFLLVKRLVLDNLGLVNASLSRIAEGDLEERVEVRANTEFSSLSDDINATVSTLKAYIAAAAARIDEELALAKSIQSSALPSVFPPYPDRKEFALFAKMKPAREVGGDFYDFYLQDEKRLAFLVADVSGKGIPAAMFMMTSKTVLREYAERGDEPADVFANANEKLCAGNQAEMFLTAWMGFLETDTGLVRFVNAGHNPPVLIRRGNASFVQQKVNLVLAMMEGVRYREQTLQMEPGDYLYLYTDGVTEAANAEGQMYGNDRLLALLSAAFGAGEAGCRKICETVGKSLKAFVGDAPQFDDITQVCLYYAGGETPAGEENRITLSARVEELPAALAFVEGKLTGTACGEKAKKQIAMAVEEVFVNIASYAYPSRDGTETVDLEAEAGEDGIRIRLSDTGIPYDPTQKPDPSRTLGVAERQFGGFGVYLVKQTMDSVSYVREGEKNILTFQKNWYAAEQETRS